MKFGYCVNMLTQPGGVGQEWIAGVKRAGFDYVELPLAQMMSLGEKAFRATVVSALDANAFPCLCCNNFFPASYRLTGPDADHESALAYASAAMARAAMLGATKIVFGSSGARNMPAGFPKEKAMTQLTSLLTSLNTMAESFGITLVLEPLNRLESNLLNSLSECSTLSRTLALPAVKALADTYHMRVGNESFEHLLDASERLQHIHVARPLGRSLPCEGDGEDWAGFFTLLRQCGYDGTISIEAYAPEVDRIDAIADSLTFLKAFA